LKASTIKWIDRKVGIWICRLLSIWSSIFNAGNKEFRSEKVLFIKLIEQGASVLAYSSLKSAVAKYGKQNVYFLVFEENRFILDFLDVLEPSNIIQIRNDSLISFTIDLFKALVKCRKEGIDSAIDMEFFSRASAIISYLSGAKKRVGLYSFTSEHPYRGNLITHKIHYNPYIHVSKYYHLQLLALEEKFSKEPLLKSYDKDIHIDYPRKQVSAPLLNSIKEKLKWNEDHQYIVLNPNASDMLPLRKWETEKFKSLASQIIANHINAKIVFTGLEAERDRIDEITNDLDPERLINLAGKTSLVELMALYHVSDLVITNDSGPAHFASMFDTKVVVLFGPETPELFAPIGENIHVIYKSLACSPCVNVFNHRFSPCTNNVCMQKITVEEVYEKAQKLIA